ncbi:MAG: tripartite tricarboxylate transporter substrate binding protein [Pseudonocardiaceae bacterium]|nr:tripartite tricarboxylate transporter substrate binding protein [Pseudonocardiaceae bacterium]
MKKSPRMIAIGLMVALAGTACAQQGQDSAADADWPSGETMKLIVGYGAGGTTDTMARSLAKQLEKKLDVQIQVENQEGAGGQRAYTELATAKPDGLTLGTLNYPTIITTMVDKSKGATYTLDDFQPLANHVNDPRVTIVRPDSQFKTAKDLVSHAKKNPLKLKGATSGLSGGGHFSMIKLEQATGADFAPVHFNEGQADAKAAFLGGHVDVYFASIGDGLEVIKAGKGRALGMADDERSPLLPDAPTFKEQGIDIQESGMRGYALPAGVPQERVDKLATALKEIIDGPKHKEELAKLSLQPDFMGPKEYTDWLKKQMPEVKKINEKSKNDE